MSSIHLTFLLVLGFLAVYAIQPINAQNPCTCTLLSCNCCQGVTIPSLGLDKKLCFSYKFKLLDVKVDISIQMDGNTVAAFTIDPKNPPSYCIPIVLPNSVAICLKLHDIKLVGLTGVQICSSFYVQKDTDQMFTYKLPCVKLATSGVSMIAATK